MVGPRRERWKQEMRDKISRQRKRAFNERTAIGYPRKRKTVWRVHLCGATAFFTNSFDRQITVKAVAESHSDVLHSQGHGPNRTNAFVSRVPQRTDNQCVDILVSVNADSSSSASCCSFTMGSTSRYSSYNCLTSWDSYDRIPR